MSRFAGRVSRDLQQIADRATPSSTAWESIRARIDEQPDQPDLEIIMLAPDDNKRPGRRLALAALATAAATAAAVVGIIALAGDDDSPDTAVAPDPPVVEEVPAPEGEVGAGEPVAVALDYLAARDAWDGPATAALIADDAVFEGPVTAEEHVANAGFERAIDFRLLDPSCTATSPETASEVACSFTVRSAWSEALGLGPLTESGFVLVIDGGQIVELREEPGFDPGFGVAWTAFRAWLDDNNPDDVDVMYDGGGARFDGDAISLFERYTTEFGAYHVALDYLAARDAWDGPATAALIADDAVFEDGPATAEEHVANAGFERAIDFRLLDPRCVASSAETASETASEVACSFTVRNAWSEALGLGPLTESGFVLVIDGGQIVELREEPGFDPGFGVAWTAFRAWLDDNHPDDLAVMYLGGAARQDSEAISLFETYTAEFVAERAG